MKTLHLIIFGIISSVIIGLAIFTIFSTNLPRLRDTPENNSGFYTVIDTPGLNNTYYAYQKIHFSVIIHGYGIYPCIQPDVTIYNNDKPGNPVFHDNQGILLCKAVYREQPENFTISYPSKIDSYVTHLNQTGNYTLNISVGNVSVQKQFSVIDAKYVDWGTNNPLNSEKQTVSTVENSFVADKNGKVNLSKIHLDRNQYGQVDYNKIGYLVSENQFQKILDEMNIPYNQDSLLFQEGMSYLTLPPFTDYCGYVKDDNMQEHWFSSSFHNDTLTNYTVYGTNPSPCKPGPPFECFCSLETRIAENNLKELSYFTASEENAVGEILVKYFDGGNVVNVSNEFVTGKYNLDIDPSLIHYCGKFTWGAQLEYFEGYIKNSTVVDLTLASEKQKLCAIKSDAKLFSFNESANGIKK